MEEATFGLNLKEREEREQAGRGREHCRRRDQLEQRSGCRSLPAHLLQLVPGGDAWGPSLPFLWGRKRELPEQSLWRAPSILTSAVWGTTEPV